MSESDTGGRSNPASDVTDAISGRDPLKSAYLIYILYLVGIAIPILPVVAVVLAYLFRSSATGWLGTHYVYLVRTFWIGLLYSIVSIVLMVVLVGWLVSIAIVVWLVVRCVKGMQHLSKREPIPDPRSWVI